MTVEEAYRKGQYDMRQRIIRQWGGWFTNTVGGHARLHRTGRPNVGLLIRWQCRVRELHETSEMKT